MSLPELMKEIRSVENSTIFLVVSILAEPSLFKLWVFCPGEQAGYENTLQHGRLTCVMVARQPIHQSKMTTPTVWWKGLVLATPTNVEYAWYVNSCMEMVQC